MKKAFTVMPGLKVESGSQEQTELPRGLLRDRLGDEP